MHCAAMVTYMVRRAEKQAEHAQLSLARAAAERDVVAKQRDEAIAERAAARQAAAVAAGEVAELRLAAASRSS